MPTFEHILEPALSWFLVLLVWIACADDRAAFIACLAFSLTADEDTTTPAGRERDWPR
jgi:hypothetical protein